MSEKQFEDQLKKKFEDYEIPVTPNLWANVSKGLGGKSVLISASYKWLIAGMIVGGGAIGAYFTLGSDDKSKDSLIQTNSSSHSDSNATATETNIDLDASQELQNKNNLEVNITQLRVEANSPQEVSNNGSQNFGANNNANEKMGGHKENSPIESGTFSTAKTHCVGAEVSFNSPSTPDDVSFLWNFGDGSFSNESNPKHKYLNPGTYVVSLSVSGSKSAQINTMNMSETITILTTPKADFDWSFNNVESGKPVVSINNQSEAAVNFEWNFHDGKKSTEYTPSKVISSNGNFPISITAIHENGCKDTKIKYVSINENEAIHAPLQTLAGDAFMPAGLHDLKGNFVLSIYDNGKKIFETKTIKRPWTGIDTNGRYHEVNKQYTWIIITKDSKSGASNYYSGKVLLKP
jgi:PKD repeat protein